MRIAISALLLLAGCTSGGDALVSEDALSSSVVGTGGDDFVITAYGTGEVPIGSTCAPGDAAYTLDFALMTVAGTRCESGRVASYQGAVTQADRDTFNQALRATADTTATPCVLAAEPYVRLAAWQGGGQLGTWVSECDNPRNTRRASALAGVFLAARTIAANATPAPVPPPTILGTGQSIWSVNATSLKLDLFGHGTTPVGSNCVPGAREYLLLSDDTGANFQLGITTCTLQASGMARSATAVHVYARADLAAVFDLLAHPVAGAASCDVTKDVAQLRVTHRGGVVTAFASPESDCTAADAPFEPIEDIAAIASALDAL